MEHDAEQGASAVGPSNPSGVDSIADNPAPEGPATLQQPLETDNIEENPDISNEERWSLIWTLLIIYSAYNAIVGFFVSLGGFLANMIFYIVVVGPTSSCSQADKLFILSTVIFGINLCDMTLGCCTVGYSWFLKRSPAAGPQQQHGNILPHIRNSIIICTVQLFLSLGGIVIAIVGLVQNASACAGSGAGMAFNILLFLDSGWELFIWIGAYVVLRKGHANAPIPDIVDQIVPDSVWEIAKRIQL
ncbi:expressed unknown protein [Seminavis robusta]|uniref:Transmembrane protein n=1 Tax=Seminavis robusta TaxID=568900 RepID=A0A9N8HX75_9STRA|nr:expressed unknown protein [Seminavis robusta]|eukprot:Sro2963_g341040.1 n/a (246) ;mRNA; r:1808-2545